MSKEICDCPACTLRRAVDNGDFETIRRMVDEDTEGVQIINIPAEREMTEDEVDALSDHPKDVIVAVLEALQKQMVDLRGRLKQAEEALEIMAEIQLKDEETVH